MTNKKLVDGEIGTEVASFVRNRLLGRNMTRILKFHEDLAPRVEIMVLLPLLAIIAKLRSNS